jgi:hypothetical protein
LPAALSISLSLTNFMVTGAEAAAAVTAFSRV